MEAGTQQGELDRAEALLGRRYGGTVKDFGREQSGQSTTIYGLMENKVAPKAGDYAIALYLEETYPDRPTLFGGEGGKAMARFIDEAVKGLVE